MVDTLDQSEVDALLAAVSNDDTRTDDSARNESGPSATPGVTPYNFKRPERVSKDQMRALQSIHETFARNFGASLSGFLRAMVETRVVSAEQLTYSEFIQSLPSPTCFNLLSAPPLSGQLCMELSPLIVFPIVDRLLGGTNADIFIPQRPLTSIETRLVSRIIDRALINLSESWSELLEVRFEVSGTESNPQLAQIVAPNEVVVVIGFEIRIGARAGTLSICIPFNVIEPVIGKLAAQSWLASSAASARADYVRTLARNLHRAEVDLRAYLGQTRITVADLLSLAPGDTLRLDKLVTEDFIVQVTGQNKLAGTLGQLRGQRALQITRHADPGESL